MSELQSFGQAVSLSEKAAPRDYGSDGNDVVRAVTGMLSTAGNIVDSQGKRRAAQAEAQATGAVAQGYIEVEDFKRRESLQEAVAAGHMTENQATAFGRSEQASLDALNQASAQGMGASVRNALERSVRYQYAAMKNPAAAKELAAAYGIGDNGVESDTLSAIEKVERQQLEEDADYIRGLAQEEGYTEFLNKSNEDVLDMWEGSPAAARDRKIKQNLRKASDQEASISARSPAVSENLSIGMSNFAFAMNKAQSAYGELKGTDGTSMSFAEELNLMANDVIAEARATYGEFPKALETFATGIQTMVAQRVKSQKDGLSQGTAEYQATVTRPIELAKMHEDLVSRRWQNSQNSIRGMQNVLQLETRVHEERVKHAKLQDEVLNASPAEPKASLAKFVQDPATLERMAAYNVDLQENGTMLLEAMVNPDTVKYKQALNSAAGILSTMPYSGGVANNQAAFKGAIQSIAVAHELNVDASPSKAKQIEASVLQLANDPEFIKQSKSSVATKRLLTPLSAGIKSEIIGVMQQQIEGAVSDRVFSPGGNLPGSRENNIAVWRKLGQYMVIDKPATNKAGVPQYKLVDGIEEALTTDDIVRQGEALSSFNDQSIASLSPNQFDLLESLTGAKDRASAIEQLVRSADGVSLGSLDPARRIEPRDPEAVKKDQDLLKDLEENGVTF